MIKIVDKKLTRIRRAKKTRLKIKELNMPRLSVHRTSRNIYAQLILPEGRVLTAVSSLSDEVKKECAYGGNIEAATIIGKIIAEKVKNSGVTKVAFDRSGFRYHGRIKALADSARECGLEF